VRGRKTAQPGEYRQGNELQGKVVPAMPFFFSFRPLLKNLLTSSLSVLPLLLSWTIPIKAFVALPELLFRVCP